MPGVEQKVTELRAILAGQPLVAIHEAERLGQARLKLGELQLVLAEIPLNERIISMGEIREAITALGDPETQYKVYDIVRGFPGGIPPDVQPAVSGEMTRIGQAPEESGVSRIGLATGVAGTSSLRLCLRSVLIGVATVVTASLVLRAIPGTRRT